MDQDSLIAMITELGVPFYFERSFQVSASGLSTDRCLVAISNRKAGDHVPSTFRRFACALRMPHSLLNRSLGELPNARWIHWGLEDTPNQKTCKVYLEYARCGDTHGSGKGPVLLHVGYKWSFTNASDFVRTRYYFHPTFGRTELLDRLRAIYSFDVASSPSLEIVDAVLQKVFDDETSPSIQYLEVSEEGGPRRSFDLNLYESALTIEDVRPEIVSMARRFSISELKLNTFLEQIRCRSVGHLAGGLHRNGREFFNIYYGAEHWSGTPCPATLADTICGDGDVNKRRYEYTTAGDQYFNYCWWSYQPVAAVEGKFRPVTLLYQSFGVAEIGEGAFALVEALQAELGRFRTVWGVKQVDGRLAWELYFYDYQRRSRDVSITRCLESIAHITSCKIAVNEGLPYFMFSMDIDEDLVEGNRELDTLHIYIGNPGSTVSPGIAYAVSSTTTTLENVYFFFDARRQMADAARKIATSVHIDDTVLDVNNVLRPELRDCHTICIANKQNQDTVYFSGINVDQLIFFLTWLQYPQPIRRFVETNRCRLDHLLYDVGFDYTSSGDELHILKSGYYGVF